MLLAALALLPTSLRALTLHMRCSGPLPTVLARCFSHLQTIDLNGDASDVDWRAPGAGAVLLKLRSLRLEPWDWSRAVYEGGDAPDHPYHLIDVPPAALPEGIAGALAPATDLGSLHVHACWSEQLPALVRTLPELYYINLAVMESTSAVADAAVALLAELPKRTRVSLTVHARSYPSLDEWDEWDETVLPPMAATAAAVMHLDLIGRARLPPDWRQLSKLATLTLAHNDVEQPWGSEPLTALKALSSVKFDRCTPAVLPAPALLATAPALAEVAAWEAGEWCEQLAALHPAWHITNYYQPEPTPPQYEATDDDKPSDEEPQ